MLTGKVIGNYRVVEKIGQGGMGSIFKAWDSKRKRFVAVKILQSAVDATLSALFEKEIQLLSRLDHSNIVPIYDVGWYTNYPFFVMGYIEGRSLLDVIILHQQKRRGFALVFFTAIMKDITMALHHAHSQNIFHRDLKPENILISPKRRAFLLDFGLAKLLHDRRVTPKNVLLGTPYYMSPEQIMGMEVDARTDIYSLGLIMYACLTGRLPFMDKDPMTAARRRLKEEFPPPSYRNKCVPKQIDEIVMRCLERDRKKRFQLVSDIQLVLSRFMERSKTYGYCRKSTPVFTIMPELYKQTEDHPRPQRQPRLPFPRKSRMAEARLNEIVEIFESSVKTSTELKYPFSSKFEVLTTQRARDFPKAFGRINERAEENRFILFVYEEDYHLFTKLSAKILKGELEVSVALADGGDAIPDQLLELDLTGWETEEDVDWTEVFRGLFARFLRWVEKRKPHVAV